MPGRAKKATKKFEKNHLRGTIERRKEFAKSKQRGQIRAKRKVRNASDRAKVSDDEAGPPLKKAKTKDTETRKPFGESNVDDFFEGGFELPQPKSRPKSKKRATENDVDKGEEETIADVSRPLRKKSKNSTAEEDDEESGSSTPEDPGVFSEEEAGSGEEDGIETHKEDLDALAQKDPDFYKYLKENDAELLDFGEDGDLEAIDQLSDEAELSKKGKKGGNAAEASQEDMDDSLEVTAVMVKKWKTAMSEEHSLRAMRQVALAFRAAVYVNSDDPKKQRYSISGPDVYHRLLVLALEHIPGVLNHHLPVKESASGKVRIATEAKKFRTLTPLLKSHSASLQHLLENLSDASTIKLTVSSLVQLLPYFLSFKKSLRSLCKTSVNIWSDTSTTEATRITAFLFLRRLALISDASVREAVLKTTYQGLVKGSRITNTHTLAGINLMKNSAAELWGLDADIGYTTGFTYIRQLAVHLRQTVNHPTADSYKTIYNWQYVHALDFWSRVLSTHCSPNSNPHLKAAADSPLHPLVYPLIQITIGALRLIPTPVYFPLRFHLTRSLLRLSYATTTFIPLAPSLLEVLNSPECSKTNPKPSTLAPLDFSVVLRAPKSYLGTRIYQDGLGVELAELIAESFNIWAKHIAFPELALPPIAFLKRWLKSSNSPSPKHNDQNSFKKRRQRGGNTRTHAAIALVVQKLEMNSSFIEGKRRDVRFGPTDREEVDNFLRDLSWEDTPLGGFIVGERRRKEEREKVLRDSKQAEGKGRQDKEVDKEDDFEGIEEDDDMEVEEEEEEEKE